MKIPKEMTLNKVIRMLIQKKKKQNKNSEQWSYYISCKCDVSHMTIDMELQNYLSPPVIEISEYESHLLRKSGN